MAPHGLVYVPDFLGAQEHDALVAQLERIDFGEVRMHGLTARRSVAHFGWIYGYDARGLVTGPPLPDYLLDVRRRAAEIAAIVPTRFEQALITRYPAGATIGWHRDAPMFGSTVVGLSLLSACRLRFRRGKPHAWEVFEQVVEPRSLYVIAGAARWSWQHSIPASQALRYSITLRSLRRETPTAHASSPAR